VHPPRTKLETGLLAVAFAIFVATALVIAAQLPRGRGNDEDSHATYVRYVADFGRLPAPLDIDFGVNREPHQPPLYYLGGAAWLQGARALGLQQDAVRLYSLAIGIVWFWLVWGIARRLLPVGARVLPNLALAAMPYAAHLTGTVNNDVLAITFCTALAYCVVRAYQTSPEERRSLRRWLVLGALAGAGAALGKLFAAPVVLVLGAALTWRALKTKQLPTWLLGLALAAIPVGAWMLFNFRTTGELLPELSLGAHPLVLQYLDPWSSQKWKWFFLFLWQTFVGRLGSWDIVLPGWIYWVHGAVWIVAVGSLAIFWKRLRALVSRANLRLVALFVFAFLTTSIPVALVNRDYFQPQARYIYPGLFGPLLVLALGLWLLSTLGASTKQSERWLIPAGVLTVLGVIGVTLTATTL